jgi:acyl dehydratase
MMPPQKGDRLPKAVLGPFGPDDVARYATASGDSNPIHVDPAAARAAGLPGPIVQGMLLMASMIRIAEAWRPDAIVTTARILFVQPVGVDEKLTVEGRVVGRTGGTAAWQGTLRLTARNEAGTIAATVETRLAAAAFAANTDDTSGPVRPDT